MTPPTHPTLQVLALPAVRAFVASRFSGALSHKLLTATLTWHVARSANELGGAKAAALYLGLLGLIEFLPVIPCGLVAGALADARERRSILVWTRIGSLLATLLLCAVSGWQQPLPALLGLALLLAALRCFEQPAAASLLPNLAPLALFQNAVTLNATVRNVAWVGGPVAAGFLIEAGGVAAGYAASLVCFAVSLFALLPLPRTGVAASAARIDRASIGEGLRFVFERPVLLSCMTLDMFAVILAGPRALLPLFATEVLGVGPRGFGVLSASIAAGTFAMALLLLFRPAIARPGRALLFAVGVFGISALVFGLSEHFALSVLALVLHGMADQVSMVARSAIVQLTTPDALRGRVNAVNFVFIGASNEFGDAFSGFLAAAIGPVLAVAAGGAACAALAAGVAARVPALRRHRTGAHSPT